MRNFSSGNIQFQLAFAEVLKVIYDDDNPNYMALSDIHAIQIILIYEEFLYKEKL